MPSPGDALNAPTANWNRFHHMHNHHTCSRWYPCFFLYCWLAINFEVREQLLWEMNKIQGRYHLGLTRFALFNKIESTSIHSTMTESNEKLSPRHSLITSDETPCNGESVFCNSVGNSSSLQYLPNEGEEKAVELDHNLLDLSTDSNAPPPVIFSKKGGGSSSERSYGGRRSGEIGEESKREIEIENECSASAIEKYTRSDEVGDFNDFNGDEMRDLRRCLVKGAQAGVLELDLDRLLQESEGYEFCCPNCHGCVKRIIIRKREDIHSDPPDVFRCVSCFSFLVLAGRHLVSLFTPEKRESTTIVKGETSSLNFKDLGQEEEEESVHVSLIKSTVVDSTNKDMVEKTISSKEYIEEGVRVAAEYFVQGKNSESQPTSRISLKSAALITAAAAASKVPKQLKKKEDTIIRIEETTETGHVEAGVQQTLLDEAESVQTKRQQQSTRGLEMVKSIVYGGLMESIASTGIVTSAVGSSVSTLNMLAMALSNLFGGVIILLHNIRELRRRGGNEHVDMYYESLGRRENTVLHVTISIMSFLIFGMAPPLTYVFSFQKNGTTEIKLASAMAASLVCVTILSIGKTYVQRPRGWASYVKTVLHYACSTAVVFGVCYVAGKFIMKVIDRIELLHQENHPLTLSLHAMELSNILG